VNQQIADKEATMRAAFEQQLAQVRFCLCLFAKSCYAARRDAVDLYRAQAVAAERSARESYESELRQQVVCRCAARAATLAPAMPAEALSKQPHRKAALMSTLARERAGSARKCEIANRDR
jgi:hypothetical protein